MLANKFDFPSPQFTISYQDLFKNTRYLEQKLWQTLYDLSKENLQTAVDKFDVSENFAKKLSKFKQEQIDNITSTQLISFKTKTLASEIECIVYNPKQNLSINNAKLSVFNIYWNIYHQFACFDSKLCNLIFGTTKEVSEIIKQATILQVILISNSLANKFKLRPKEESILNMLSSQKKNSVMTFKVFQQTIDPFSYR